MLFAVICFSFIDCVCSFGETHSFCRFTMILKDCLLMKYSHLEPSLQYDSDALFTFSLTPGSLWRYTAND